MHARLMVAMAAVGTLFAGAAFAQQSPPAQGQQQQEQQAQGQQKQIPNIPQGADRIIGKTVVGEKGNQVGEISDVLVGKDGKVAGLIMEHGGTLGMGGSNVIIPWDQTAIQGDQLSLKMTDQEVSQLPSID